MDGWLSSRPHEGSAWMVPNITEHSRRSRLIGRRWAGRDGLSFLFKRAYGRLLGRFCSDDWVQSVPGGPVLKGETFGSRCHLPAWSVTVWPVPNT